MENIDFVSIYRKYRSRAFNIGKFILGDEDEAEDVCQDVFETLFHMGRSVNLEAAGYLQSIFEKLREKNRTNYEIYVSVTLYDIPTRLVARHYHITENNVNNRVMRTRRWLAREYKKITR